MHWDNSDVEPRCSRGKRAQKHGPEKWNTNICKADKRSLGPLSKSDSRVYMVDGGSASAPRIRCIAVKPPAASSESFIPIDGNINIHPTETVVRLPLQPFLFLLAHPCFWKRSSLAKPCYFGTSCGSCGTEVGLDSTSDGC
jgi:hypothetical protein